MKSSNKLILMLALFSLNTSSYAVFEWLSTQPQLLFKNVSPVMFTLTILTSTGESFKTNLEVRDFVGRSKTEPCSDMKINVDLPMQQEVKPGVYPFSADDLKYWPGAGFTCYRFEIVYGKTVYSSGNILLSWDEANKTYTAANPNEFRFYFKV